MIKDVPQMTEQQDKILKEDEVRKKARKKKRGPYRKSSSAGTR
jgi:hypothetical protein